MGDSILEYLIVGGIFLVAAIQRHKTFKILRQHKKITKSRDGGGVSSSNKCKITTHLNRNSPPRTKKLCPCSDKV